MWFYVNWHRLDCYHASNDMKMNSQMPDGYQGKMQMHFHFDLGTETY